MIEKLLNEKVIEVEYEGSTWEDVVRKSGELLLQDNKIEDKYIESMVNTVKELGAYIVIDNGIALPHGRPDDGVKDMGVSVITLKDGMNFGNEEFDPVKVVIGICATDGKKHIELIGDLSSVLDTEDFVSKCSECKEKKELIDLFINLSKR